MKVLLKEKDIIAKLRSLTTSCQKDMLCFYSNRLNAVILDPLFMSISIEDKIVHRGYAVFDTAKIFGNKIFNLDNHIDRLVESIEIIGLKSKYSKAEYRDIITQVGGIARGIEPISDIDVRYFYSAGLGNFSIGVNQEMPTFYAMGIRVDNSVRPVKGTNEVIVDIDEIKRNLVKAKTTNYMINCIVNSNAKARNGYLGIMVDDQGDLLDTSISSIAFVLNDNSFVVPPFTKTLKGTTVIKCMKYIEENLINQGRISKIVRRFINKSELKPGLLKEMLIVGGDFVIPVLKIDDIEISNAPGEITILLQKHISEQKIEKAEEIKIISPEMYKF